MGRHKLLDLKQYIRDIPDFPKQGIIFKDITPLLQDKDAFRQAIERMAAPFKDRGIDAVASVEARGFIFGAAIAYYLKTGFIPMRKPGKLPFKTISQTYDLEYGKDTIQIHEDALAKGNKVLIVDDVLATGGTVEAVAGLLEKIGAETIGIAFLIELTFLKGIEKLKKYPVHSLMKM